MLALSHLQSAVTSFSLALIIETSKFLLFVLMSPIYILNVINCDIDSCDCVTGN